MRTITSLHVATLALAIGGLLAGPLLLDARANSRGKENYEMAGGSGSWVSIGAELRADADAIQRDRDKLTQDQRDHNNLEYRADAHRFYLDTERQEYDRDASDDED